MRISLESTHVSVIQLEAAYLPVGTPFHRWVMMNMGSAARSIIPNGNEDDVVMQGGLVVKPFIVYKPTGFIGIGFDSIHIGPIATAIVNSGLYAIFGEFDNDVATCAMFYVRQHPKLWSNGGPMKSKFQFAYIDPEFYNGEPLVVSFPVVMSIYQHQTGPDDWDTDIKFHGIFNMQSLEVITVEDIKNANRSVFRTANGA